MFTTGDSSCRILTEIYKGNTIIKEGHVPRSFAVLVGESSLYLQSELQMSAALESASLPAGRRTRYCAKLEKLPKFYLLNPYHRQLRRCE